jgi:NADH dehydrogenase [ubiquinone] 1 alpha subcomplex assembly factor 7
VSPEASLLAQQLAKQMEATGPISVAEYMRIANMAYYAKGDVFGTNGDFTTAPEISQMFGEMVGLWLTDIWMRGNRSPDIHYVELGPGRGSLASDALRSMQRFDFNPDVHFVETSETLRGQQARAVPSAKFCDDIDGLPDDGHLFIVANEFFDALPVRQFVATHSGWRERVVGRDRGNQFQAMPGFQPVDELVPAEFRAAPAPSVYETCPQASTIMYDIAGRLSRQGGVLLITDYGYAKPGLGSTLQSLKNHAPADPFRNPGEQDLTAHVNFLELANLARMRHLRVDGPVEQGAWLQNLGIDARAHMLSMASPERSEDIHAMRDRLVQSEQMGSLFKVLAVSSSDWPIPEGFVQTQLPTALRDD